MFYTIVDTLKLGDFSIKVPRTDAAFGGWCEACGAKLASLAFEGASPFFGRLQRPMQEKISDKKKSESENFSSIEI